MLLYTSYEQEWVFRSFLPVVLLFWFSLMFLSFKVKMFLATFYDGKPYGLLNRYLHVGCLLVESFSRRAYCHTLFRAGYYFVSVRKLTERLDPVQSKKWIPRESNLQWIRTKQNGLTKTLDREERTRKTRSSGNVDQEKGFTVLLKPKRK